MAGTVDHDESVQTVEVELWDELLEDWVDYHCVLYKLKGLCLYASHGRDTRLDSGTAPLKAWPLAQLADVAAGTVPRNFSRPPPSTDSLQMSPPLLCESPLQLYDKSGKDSAAKDDMMISLQITNGKAHYSRAHAHA